jgi:hypothetical protein
LPDPKTPYDGRKKQSGCITTGGGDAETNYHPSGLRYFTPRELACLQTFPVDYQFYGGVTEIKKQVGNAVPPGVWKYYIRSVIQTLEDFDSGKIDETGQPIASDPLKAGSLLENVAVAGPSRSRVSERVEREQSRTLSPEIVPLSSRSTPVKTSLGKRKWEFVDLTVDDEMECNSTSQQRTGPADHPLLARIAPKASVVPVWSTERKISGQLRLNSRLQPQTSSHSSLSIGGTAQTHIDLTGDENMIIDLMED